jgi:RNA polymerase sigma-70 factor, ECF subfamily
MAKDVSTDSSTGTSTIEEALLIKAACTELSAFNQLYLLYIGPIYRYIFSKVGESKEAEDLTAQVFLAALEGLARYRHNGHFAAWLFSIARHKISDHFRYYHPEIWIEAAYGEVCESGDLLTSLIQSEEVQRMSELIHSLNERDQELLRLRFVAGLNFGEIAQLCHSNVERTKKRIYRLLARLKQQMEFNHV